MSVLIIAEHNNHQLNQSTLHAIQAAAPLGETDVLVAGFHAESVAEQVRQVAGVHHVLLAEAEHYAEGLAEELAPLIVRLASSYAYIAATATGFGKNVLPRVAALLDCSQVSDLTKIIDKHTFVRPVYAGNVDATVHSDEAQLVLTFRATAFAAAAVEQGRNAPIENVAPTAAQNISRFVSRALTQSDRPELTQAKVVVSGGRALGSAEQFNQVLLPLADKLNAAIGASRAAVDAGYAPNDVQVGQTGKVVAPDLYIAVGISGAIQHVAGMHGSKVIVAINKDPEAPIFKVADYGLVADLFTAVPEFVTELSR